MYGISLIDYENMFAYQNGKCKICKIDSSKLTKILVIDHCHKTGRVRGLLCDRCNVGLGSFKDDSMLLRSAASYLDSKEIDDEETSGVPE
jgi:hypothetical protein